MFFTEASPFFYCISSSIGDFGRFGQNLKFSNFKFQKFVSQNFWVTSQRNHAYSEIWINSLFENLMTFNFEFVADICMKRDKMNEIFQTIE